MLNSCSVLPNSTQGTTQNKSTITAKLSVFPALPKINDNFEITATVIGDTVGTKFYWYKEDTTLSNFIGEGTTSHSFTESKEGQYTYYLRIQSKTQDKWFSKTVTILPEQETPITAKLTVSPSTPTAKEHFIIYAAVNGGTDTNKFYWYKEDTTLSDFIGEGTTSHSFTESITGTYTYYLRVQSTTQDKWFPIKVTVSSTSSGGGDSWNGTYPVHRDITASLFWVGEPADGDNGGIQNIESAWRGDWMNLYGLEDKPYISRDSDGFPTSSSYKNKENPYYFALPYNDFGSLVSDGNGNDVYDASLTVDGDQESVKKNQVTAVYWGQGNELDSVNSIVKNRWVKIEASNGNVAYAQWEDAGPFYYNDINYVFGTSSPLNNKQLGAGIDLSPAVMHQLFGDAGRGEATVLWQFVEESDVPSDPWKKVVTTVNMGGW